MSRDDKVINLDSAGLKPWSLRLLNRVMPASGKLDAARISDSALRKSGMTSFDEEYNEEALDVLVGSINSEAELTPFGRMVMQRRLTDALTIRLRAVKLLQQHPEILDQTLAPVWWITGLQRTGTTFLQRLLSADPDARALLSWESLDPVPRGNRDETSKRLATARRSERALKWMAPSFFAIHPIDHSQPEEDVLLLDPTLFTTAHEALMHVPTYSEWLEDQDHTQAYAWERQMLLILQWQRPARRWILKSPHHLEHLTTMRAVFPEMQVIWTHRDPTECMTSFLSMVYHGRALFSNLRSTDQVRDHWLAKSAMMIDRALEYSRGHEDLTNVRYEALVNDPAGTVLNIHRCLGLEVDDKSLASTITDVTREHGRYRFGRHVYSMQEFGLNHDDIHNAFGDYYRFTDTLS